MRLASGNASLRCEYCKSVLVMEPDDAGMKFLDEVAELECPVCSVSLWTAVLANAPIHACKRCGGMLVAMGALEGLIDQMRAGQGEGAISAPADPTDLLRNVRCPQCRTKMDTDFYYGGGHVAISSCEPCSSLWLDGGVLMKIVRVPHHSEADQAF